MAQQLGSSRNTDGNSAGYDLASGAGRQNVTPGNLTRHWWDFLAGPRLQSGPALAIIVLASLILWAAVIWLLYILLHH